MAFQYWIAQSGAFESGGNWSRGAAPDANSSLLVGAGGAVSLMAESVFGRVYANDQEVSSLVLSRGASLTLGGAYTYFGGSIVEAQASLKFGYLHNEGTIVLRDASALLPQDAGALVVNQGLITAVNFDDLTPPRIEATLDNQGMVGVESDAVLTVQETTNLAAKTLTGGAWRVASGGTLSLSDDTIETLAGGAIVTLAGAGATMTGAGEALDATLTTIAAGATLAVLGSRGYDTIQTLQVDGTLQLGGGTVSTSGIAVGADGRISGYGTIMGSTLVMGEIVTVADASRHPQTLTVAGQMRLVDGDAGISGQGTLAITGQLEVQGTTVASRTVANDGTIIVGGDSTIAARLVNHGSVNFYGDVLTITAAVGGQGTINVSTDGTLHLAGSVGGRQTIALSGFEGHASLRIDQPAAFKATIISFDNDDQIDLAGLTWHDGYVLRWNPVTDRLNIADGTTTVRLHLDGDFDPAGFQLSDDGHGGTLLIYADPATATAVHADFALAAHPAFVAPAELACLV